MLSNTELWDRISAFGFDEPGADYSFSTRLITENEWSIGFTAGALLGYKKFMYLATISNMMVSPSPIVDVVWHQHLVFTNSYKEFCHLLGKQIQHVPATHHNEGERFREAKERTKTLYEREFGQQPIDYWTRATMFDSLELPKAGLKTRNFLNRLILVLIAFSPVAYMGLGPLYKQIYGLMFLAYYIPLVLMVATALVFYNRKQLNILFEKISPGSFIKNLERSEVIYLETAKLSITAFSRVNLLVQNEAIEISNNRLKLLETFKPINQQDAAIFNSFSGDTAIDYQRLENRLLKKPAFKSIEKFGDALLKYYKNSTAYNRLFYINSIVLSLLLYAGGIRLVMGLLHGKSILFLLLTLVLVFFGIVWLLTLLENMFTREIVPAYYKKSRVTHVTTEDAEWAYLVVGAAAIHTSMVDIAPTSSSFAGSGNSHSGSSCGSSCGGGGCGGGCGGCGGCGGG